MSSDALAIKWRPKSFQSVVGQDHTIKALQNALENNRLHHAWLLTGTRGVGKTTIARILARSLNCERGVSPDPCGVCVSCDQIIAGRAADVIELDAASNTQVDNMRELLETALYSPSSLRFKVFIIDEVHMLSKSAFNAMLKTLEEPPPHVKFILATTDPRKVPVTVLSRCLQFGLKKIPTSTIVKQLGSILTNEEVTYAEEALIDLARAADGSMRDALSLVDQAIAFGNSDISAEVATQMLGDVGNEKLLNLVEALGGSDNTEVMRIVQEICDSGASLEKTLASLASIINNISLLKAFPDALGEDFANKKQLEDLGENFDPEDLQLMYQIAIFGRRDFEWAPDEFAGFSMTVLRMLAFKPLESEFLQEENPGQEKKENQKKKITKRTDDFVRVNSKFVEDWPNYVKKLKLGGMAGMLANNCTLIDYKENVLEFVVPEGLSNLLTDAYKQKFKKALDVSLDKNVDMRFSIAKVVETPASLEIKEKKDKADSAADSLKKDVFVSELMADFDAKIVEDSIKLKDK